MMEPSENPTPEVPAAATVRMADALMASAGFLVEARDSGTVAQRIVDEVRHLFRSIGALLCRLDRETGVLEAIAVAGDVGPEYGVHMVFAPGMGTPGLAVRTPDPVVTPNILNDSRITLSAETRAAIEHASFRSVLAVALVLKGSINGTLCILDREGRAFTEQDGHFAQAFAHQAALALENARLNEMAETARAEAVTANRAKDDFLAIVSHELRAPITSIYGWVRMLRAAEMDKHNTERALAAVEQSTLLQTRLINDLLDVSRIVAGRLAITRRPVPLMPTIMGAVDSLRNDAEAKGVELVTQRDTMDCAVVGDQFRLHQIITNLVGNAVKFTPRGGAVELTVRRYRSIAIITVRDTGDGISAARLPLVFERFGRGKPTAGRGEGGLGLGLSIVRHLVALHGGHITAESAGEGQGATFVVFLPVTDHIFEAFDSERDDDRAAAPLQDRAILLVEDNADTRELIAFVLREAGASVVEAASLAETRAALARSLPDLLVSDLMLSDGEGFDVLTTALAAAHDVGRTSVPAIALTGLGDEPQRRRALAAGFQAYLVKPIDPLHLVELATTAVGI
jgi:signal transduction histidine kinase/ActR/RegA family two-component response regulator